MNDLSFKEWLFAEEVETTPSSSSAAQDNQRDWPSWYKTSTRRTGPVIGATKWEPPGGGEVDPARLKRGEPGEYRRFRSTPSYQADPNHDVALQSLLGFSPPSGRSWTKEIGTYAVKQFSNMADKNEVNQKINTAINDLIVRFNDPKFGKKFADEDGDRSFVSFKQRLEQVPNDEAKVNIIKGAIRKLITQQFAIDARQLGKQFRGDQRQKTLGARLGAPVKNISMSDLQQFVGTPDYDNLLRQMDPATGGRRVGRDWMSQRYASKTLTDILKGDPDKATRTVSQIIGHEATPEEVETMRKELEQRGFALPDKVFKDMAFMNPEVQKFTSELERFVTQELKDEKHEKSMPSGRGRGRRPSAEGLKIYDAAIDVADDYLKDNKILIKAKIEANYPELANQQWRVTKLLDDTVKKVLNLYGSEEQKQLFNVFATRRERGLAKARAARERRAQTKLSQAQQTEPQQSSEES